MQRIFKIVILTSFVFLSGCAIKHDYTWDEYVIQPERISSEVYFSAGQTIRVISGKSDDATFDLGNVGVHHYYGSHQLLADGIVAQLDIEMRKMQLEVDSTADKSLEIVVNNSNFESGMWKIAATLDCTVKFGNGKSKLYSVRNSSPGTVDRTYNGLVAVSVIDILNDPEVHSYINE